MRHKERLAFITLVLLIGGFFSSLRGATLEATPATYLAVLPTLKPGDICTLRAGAYTSAINNLIPSGSSTLPILVQAAPGEIVWLRPSSTQIALYLVGKSYIVFDHINIDGLNCTSAIKLDRAAVGSQAANHITFKNAEIKNCHETAIVPVYTSDFNQWLNLNIHSNGKTLDGGGLYGYAFYMRGSNNLIDTCDIWDQGGAGMQIYANAAATEPPVNNTIRNTRVHNNCVMSKPQGRGSGITLASGSGHKVQACDIRDNFYGVFVSGATGNLISDSTICSNPAGDIEDPSNHAQKVNNKVGQCGATTTPPPSATNLDVTQTQPPVYQEPPTPQPSGPSTSQVAMPFLIAGVIGAALLLGD